MQGLDFQRDARVIVAERLHGLWNQAQAKTRQAADAQLPFGLQRQIACERANALEARLEFLRLAEQQLGFTCRQQAAVRAAEQADAEVLLGVREHFADGGLRYA
ncbi:hypothetical protein DP43_5459 [Burkholderia pseudomallei]|nr:hypothetical protein DP43_5459 [Burkholderia pseudomallei]